MIVTEIPVELDCKWFSDSQYRSPGLHLSQIITSLGNALEITNYDTDTDWLKDPARARASLGFMWENFVSEQLRDTSERYADSRIFRPEEVTCDGIIGSPDGVDVELPGIREYKCTQKSSRQPIDDETRHWSWWTQIKAYCYMMGFNKAILMVFFLNSDYDKNNKGPEIKAFEATFTERELKENWDSIVNHAKEMGWL